jgi:hypothetical protein
MDGSGTSISPPLLAILQRIEARQEQLAADQHLMRGEICGLRREVRQSRSENFESAEKLGLLAQMDTFAQSNPLLPW